MSDHQVTQVDGRNQIGLLIGNRVLVVREANLPMRLKRQRFADEAQRWLASAKANGNVEVEVEALISYFYPRMAGCTEGHVPSLPEFVNMKDTDVDIWYTACVQINPHWFNEVDVAETGVVTDESQLKKKES